MGIVLHPEFVRFCSFSRFSSRSRAYPLQLLARTQVCATPSSLASTRTRFVWPAGRRPEEFRSRRSSRPTRIAIRARGSSSSAHDARDSQQDSTLVAYDETSHERLTIGLGVGSAGPEKLFLRSETAARVRWQRGRGAVVDVVGARSAVPMLTPGVHVMTDMLHIEAIPYYPGRESLLHVTGVKSVDGRDERPRADQSSRGGRGGVLPIPEWRLRVISAARWHAWSAARGEGRSAATSLRSDRGLVLVRDEIGRSSCARYIGPRFH